ncbi:response regulator [Marinicella sediminis]|uniref:Response regulator n=1 Tax=Marinicella sediminis TaxID=1792834 RepID=A0ABV7JD10_9GAMM|nr:DNA-binding response regulator [Marinicella sediminis]
MTADLNATILVVDDNTDSLGLLNQALSDAGYTVLIAQSGLQALSVIHKTQPDLILLDAIMPEMDGFATCQAIRHLNEEVPVIFMTGLSETEHVVQGLSSGAVDYLVKPLNHTELLARIKVHLSNARMASHTKAALDSTGQHLAALDSKGQLKWTTEKARNYLAEISHQQRTELLEWLLIAETTDFFECQQDDNSLIITYLSRQPDDSHLIKFKSQSLKLAKQTLKNKLKITRRESDVLYWVAQGKTDWEISQILHISERTVNKHLEQIYRKLEVSNRTAASGKAITALQ